MAAALMGRTEVGVREFGFTVTIPDDPRAKLMYYLDSICAVLDLSDQANLGRLSNYRNYYSLTEQETDLLVSLAFLLSPDELNGKVIFQDDSMCGNSNNQFFELSAVRTNLLISESIMIGGQRRAVHKIMAYKQQWILTNWVNPMHHFTPRLARIATGQQSQPQQLAIPYHEQRPTYQYDNSSNDDGCCCTIL